MAFSTILIGLLAVYAVYYGGNIVYDLFLSGVGQDSRVDTEEEIEIPDAENTLPTTDFISSPSSTISEEESTEDIVPEISPITPTDIPVPLSQNTPSEPAMNGGLDITELCAHVQQAKTPEDLLFVGTSWNG